ncbi:MAG TPA: metallophosphoesterase, partial [Leptolyngbyaceae cyanobacterium]
GQFTRLPNRYYTFRYGGIDFFALDSNTFNDPLPLPLTPEGDADRRQLEKRRDEFERDKLNILEESQKLKPDDPVDAERLDDLHARLSQIEEIVVDIDKQLVTDKPIVTDTEQLEWLKQRLIESWNNPDVRGRVVYFHHPPYVTEGTKWQQAQTLTIRDRLRDVLDKVAQALGSLPQGRPLVDLVLNGHAHCLEHLQTFDTGHGDSNIHWIVCGGSGFSLRRQRVEGADLRETFAGEERLVARSHLYVGRNGHRAEKRRPYSCLRIDVKDGTPPKLIVRPFVAERYQRQWHNYELQPIVI